MGGAAVGGTIQAREAEQLGDQLFAEVRDSVPRGSSALMLLAERRHVDAMIDALRGTQACLAIRRTLSDDAMAALDTVLAEAPRVLRDQSRDECVNWVMTAHVARCEPARSPREKERP